MRIAYVTIHVASELMQGGVGKKIKNQMKIWNEYGHTVTLFCLTPSEIPFPGSVQFPFNAHVNLIKREISRTAALTQMLFAIQKYDPDVIYLRYGLYSYPLHRIFTIAPVVLEINSNDITEYASRGLFFYWLNRLTRNLIFVPASGVIAPTHELTNILPPGKKKPCAVISNGININAAEILPPSNNTRPVITMVASSGMDWHGVDKLVNLGKACPQIFVNIVGYSKKEMKSAIPENVHLHGFLNHIQIREIYQNTDVACGTLALHRKKMNEACTLKVREALTYGIPVILGYYDTDLSNLALDTVLQIPNTEDNVSANLEQISEFVFAMMGKRVEVEKIYPVLDQRNKEMARLEFFENIAGGSV